MGVLRREERAYFFFEVERDSNGEPILAKRDPNEPKPSRVHTVLVKVRTGKLMVSIGRGKSPYTFKPAFTDEDHADIPLFLGDFQTRYYWIFRSIVYSVPTELNFGEVKALILEGENKVKAQVARAVALAQQVELLEQVGRQPIPDDIKIFVWQRDQGWCVNCGDNKNLEFDHIIPVSMGGGGTARNLQLLCEPCNRAKGGSLV